MEGKRGERKKGGEKRGREGRKGERKKGGENRGREGMGREREKEGKKKREGWREGVRGEEKWITSNQIHLTS